ncbi:MAG: PepSY-like domain-containing protein [Oscillibacter sp.]|nr:PepSY-like domain-containing protein [Oscillibacter sp.]
MKLKFLLLAVILGSLSLFACSDDDDYTPDETVQTAFEAKYPNATRVSWEKKGIYRVAEFRINNQEIHAWFDNSGEWFMTKTELETINALPAKVQKAFNDSEYATWKVDDVDKVERPESEPVYVIEVEQGKKEIDLYYSEEGILIKTVIDDDSKPEDHLTNTLPASVKSFIQERYPNARIIEYEIEKGNLEVDIIDENKGKEVVFNSNYEWLYTKYEVFRSEVPENVMNTLNTLLASQYAGYVIDDIDFYETSTTSYYRFELESGNREVKIDIDTNGNILN